MASRWYTRMEAGWTADVTALVDARYPYPAKDMQGNVLAFHDSKGLKVAFIYNRCSPPDICIHVVAREGALWCHEDILAHVFAYPFGQLELGRCTVPVLSGNEASKRMVEALGFVYEGTLRRAGPGDQDILLYGILREECRWFNERKAA